MKKQLMSIMHTNSAVKFIRATALVLMFSGSAYSNTVPDPGVAEIRYLSTTNNALLFEVKVANRAGEKFTVLIRDNSGVTLYRGVYNEKNFNKKFQFPKAENDKLVFIVRSASGKKTESFSINSNTRIVEDVVVKKVG